MLLTGDYIELPIDANGRFLTNQGAKFNSRGTGGASGIDFWVHGTPVYNYTIEANGVRRTNGNGWFVRPTVQDTSVGDTRSARIFGYPFDGLYFERNVQFSRADRIITIADTFRNTSARAFVNLATLDNTDPDQGVPLGLGYNTYNDVVDAASHNDLMFAAVNDKGNQRGLTIGFGWRGETNGVSVLGVNPSGLENTSPYSVIRNAFDPNGTFSDVGINLASDFGTLDPGQTKSAIWYIVFGATTAEAVDLFTSAADTVAPDTTIVFGPESGSLVCALPIRFAWAGTDNRTPPNALEFAWRVDGGSWSGWSRAVTTELGDLADGEHTFAVRARDGAGNVDASPAIRAFTLDTRPLTITDVAANVRSGEATITWATSRPATGLVEYGLTPAYGTSTSLDNRFLTSHDAHITGLRPDTTYHFRVRSRDACGRELASDDATFVFVTAAPDLQVAAVTAPAEILTDRAFDLSWTDTNAGRVRANGPWVDQIYLSRDALPGEGDVLLAEFELGGPLDPGQSAQRVQTLTIPRARVPEDGAYYLVVVTDASNRVNEPGHEDNNFGNASVLLRRPPLPDLVVSTVSAPERAFFGQTIGVEWTVTNVGTAATDASEWHDQVFLSSNPTPSGDAALQVEVINASYLNAGESYVGRATVHVPRGLTGRYYVVVRADSGNGVAEDNEANNVASRPIELLLPPVPDLQVTQVQAAEEAFAGDTLLVTWRVENRGTGAVPPNEATWTDAVYLSPDEQFNPRTNRLLGVFGHTGALAPGEGYAQSQAVRVPKSVAGGEYRVFVLTDNSDQVYEYLFGNNNFEHDRRRPTRVISTPPDLTVTSVTAPTQAEAGHSISVGWTVTNQAAFSAEGNWLDAVYVSGTPTLDVETAALLARVSHDGTLDAGASYTQSASVTLPACLSGPQYLFVVTDSTNALFEFAPTSDAEQNTSAPQSIQVTSRPPDLIVTDVTALANGVAGQPVSISWTVKNAGTGPTLEPSWTDRVLLSRTLTLDTAAALSVDSFSHSGALEAGDSYSRTELVTLPRQAQGAYYVLMQTNADHAVNECGTEGNNVGRSARTIEVGSDLPNLEVVRLEAPNAAVTGRKVTLNWSVVNAGGAAVRTPAWNDVVYLSSDPALSDDDRILASVITRGPLEVGATYDAAAEVTIPNVPAGTYYLIVAADRGDYVFEGARENNIAVLPVLLAPPDVDLRVTAVDLPPTAYSGQALSVAWTVTNAGAEATPVTNWTDRVILSRDQTPNPNDPVVGYAVREEALAGGTSYTQTLSVNVPRGLSGPYFLFVRTDANDVVPETNEANNTSGARAIQLQLPPPSDLIVADIVVPSSGTPGESATFRWTVRNQSENPATGQWEDAVYLSTGETWDVGDPFVGRVAHTGPVAPGQTYEASLTEVLPALTEGRYRVIVRTDIRNTVRETGEDNNTTVSTGEMTVGVPEMTLGTPLASDLRAGQERYYRVHVPAGETLRVTLDSQATDSANELYVRFGAAPSRANYDFFFSRPYEADQEVVVPTTEAGDYYILVRGEYVASGLAPFTILAEIVPFEITSVSPLRVGDNGQVTITLRGGKFQSGATVQLRSGDTILTAAKVMVLNSAVSKARFLINNVPHGRYDVVLENPGGTLVTQAGVITIETATQMLMELSTSGLTTPRIGRSLNIDSVLVNAGNIDIPYAPVVSSFSADVTVTTRRPAETLLRYADSVGPESAKSLVTNVKGDGTTSDQFLVRDLEVGQQLPFQVEVTGFGADTFGATVQAEAMSTRDYLAAVKTVAEDTRNLALIRQDIPLTSEMVTVINNPDKWWRFYEQGFIALSYIDPETSSLDVLSTRHLAMLSTDGVDTRRDSGEDGRCPGYLNCAYAAAGATGGCTALAGASLFFPPLAAGIPACIIIGGGTVAAVCLLDYTRNALDPDGCTPLERARKECRERGGRWSDCLKSYPPGNPERRLPERCKGGCIEPRRAVDPNDKVGLVGYGPQSFVNTAQPLPYTINFENVATATAAAQRVHITDQLDPNLDWRTFRLTEIGFGKYRVPVPDNRSFYRTRIQLGEDLGNLLADISAGLDVRTGQVRWTLTAIDPATGEQPESAALGLLPPNDATNRGQGFVRYTVRSKSGLPTGTVITSAPATIVFDTEQPLATNAVTNTLDSGAPTSQVAPLSAEASNTTFTVSWSGSDDSPDGSGLDSFDVFVSENDGPFTLWLSRVSDTSATYTGQPGRTYRFYSVARDNVGNVEATPGAPQAATHVSDIPTNPVPVLGSLAPASVEAGSPSFVLIVNGRDFVDGSEVLWNGQPRPTTFVSATQLTAVIPAVDVVGAGTVQVVVSSPAPGGGTSDALEFTVSAPVVGSPTLLVTGASARRVGNTLVVDVVLANSGNGGATGVRLLDTTRLNDMAPNGTLPDPVTLAAGSGSATVSLSFPGTAADPGSRVTLKVEGTSDQGGFTGSRRVNVP